MKRWFLSLALVSVSLASQTRPPDTAADKLTFHHDPQRSGWNARERILTPAAVADGRFGPIWQSPPLDGYEGVPPRLFASPLYMRSVAITAGPHAGRRTAAAFAVASTGYAYAIAAATTVGIAPGTILWRARLSERPCDEGREGAIATPVIDPVTARLYVTSCDANLKWRVHALDLGSGREAVGWPMALNASAINRPGINRNGANRFADERTIIQRGALNLSADGKRLYVAIGPDSTGWLVSVDAERAAVASAFSSTASSEEDQGGMWAAAGPSIDGQGRIHIATGSKFLARARKGVAGIFPDSSHNWGQSVLQLRDGPDGLTLIATYSPFNYCQAGAADIDLGASGTALFDLPVGATSTPSLLAVGGKQGNLYLLDRDRLPGGTVKRPPCSTDPDTDGSLLAPEPQPHFGVRGPINLFGPYSDYVSMLDQAKSRSTPAFFTDAGGATFLFATGSAKTGDDFSVSAPPGLARVRIVAAPGRPAFPRIDGLEKTQTFQNPGSPVVSSAGGAGAVVWVLDTNAPRSTSLYGDRPPKPILYAFEALSLKLLWKSAPGTLFPSGKYNEPTVVDGMALVGTDRIQAFGLRGGGTAARTAPVPALPRRPAAPPAGATAAAGRDIFRARCASCHATNQPGTPTRAQLARLSPGRIEAALIGGVMQPMATGMSRRDVASVARFLTQARQ